MYGTTEYGGLYHVDGSNGGTLYKVNTDNTGFQKLVDFNRSGIGKNPKSNLVIDGNTIYGTYEFGGPSYPNSIGGVFKVDTSGSGYTVIKNFIPSSGTGRPFEGLVRDGTTLYGVTSGFYTKSEMFKIENDVTYTALGNYSVANYGMLALYGSTLYGTSYGSGANGTGFIYKINTDGSNKTILHSFNVGGEGGYPLSTLSISADGSTLYGINDYGGTGTGGTLFSYDIAGDTYNVLHNFSGGNHLSSRPTPVLADETTGEYVEARSDGNLYYNDGAGGGDILIGAGANPSISGGKILYMDFANWSYRVWDSATQLPTDVLYDIHDEYSSGGSINNGKIVVENYNGIDYSSDSVNFTTVLSDADRYRHPVLAGNKMSIEYYDRTAGTSEIRLYDINNFSSYDTIATVDINFPTDTYGAAPWLSYDGVGTYYMVWQAWDTVNSDWDIFYWDSSSMTILPVTPDATDWDSVNGKWYDDLYPRVSSDGSYTVLMRQDDWDIYQWTETGGLVPVSNAPGVDEMYPTIGNGGEVFWSEYQPGTEIITGFSSGFAQQGGGGQVPEPSTLLLLLPLLGFGIRRIKRSARL